MPRFFISPEQLDIPASSLYIIGEDAHHIARSLRMAVGDTLSVCTPDAVVHTCRLTQIRDDRADAEILSSRLGESEPPYALRLFMAYPKGDKLETVIQKAVELGATRITPFDSERCIKRPAPEKQGRITERLSRIAAEAAKQCGRARLVEIDPPCKFADMLKAASACDLALFCYEGDGTESLMTALPKAPPATIAVIVGSEGGFSPAEASAAKSVGLQMVNLGPRILRCETAPDYVLAALSCRYELENPTI